jgi:hypothetical protein
VRSDGFTGQLVRALARNDEPFVAVPRQPGALWFERFAGGSVRSPRRAAPSSASPFRPDDGRPPARFGVLRLVAVAVAVMVMCVVAYSFGFATGIGVTPADPSRSPTAIPSPEPSPTPDVAVTRTQGAAIDALLQQSIDIRLRLNTAIQQVQECRSVAQAVTDLNALTTERQQQVDLLAGLDLSGVPDGEQLRTDLSEAFSHAYVADVAFRKWAAAANSDCSTSSERRDLFEQGTEASERTRAAKDRFLRSWNPVATQLGLPTRSVQEI